MKIKNYILAATRNLQEHLTRLLSATVRQVAALFVSIATASVSFATAFVSMAAVFVGMATVFVGCVDEIPNPESPEREATFCVRAAWQDGLHSRTTRALPSLTETAGGEDIVIAPSAYPSTINITCSDGTDFTLSKGSSACATHTGYYNYTPSVIYKDRQIERDNLKFRATATIDTDPELGLGEELQGEADFSDLHDSHLRITLHHTKALLRFAFRVASKYNIVRYIKITGIQLNGTPCHLADKVLTTDYQVVAYAYIDPEVVTTSTENTLKCTYNVYDKDPSSSDQFTSAHITRPGVEAQNKFKLSALKDFKDLNDPKDLSTPIVLTPGFYYDLLITLDPDYLYTLSDHDEPTDLILH